ncbi:DUF4974 domain-containing protein [Chitinophaga lutea]|uniref:DUF4974 domain-containing protein n=1 Tax=Chitinophaga lutea TaxID=2488634 RepID=A0A3N4PYQ4_9BACT|nr:FecR domain-containing protein [Chitinophaga lutea]RPE12545.1 DUF4974 domain-containing protein [Chitinophaga lutea]
MENHQLQKLIQKYRNGTATPAERFVVELWYQSLEEAPADEPTAISEAFISEVETRILSGTVRAAAAPKVRRLPWRWVAAAVLLPALIFTWYQWSKKEAVVQPAEFLAGPVIRTFKTGPMEQQRVVLPDSTVVVLNANTELRVLADYTRNARKVALQGEAFFDVRKDPLRPFVIEGGDLDIRVLGTSFNVQAYPAVKSTKVAVHTGMVRVSLKEKILSALKPGEELKFDRRTGGYNLGAVADNHGNSWMTGVVVLDQSSFQELSQTMYNMYGWRLVTGDAGLLKDRYNITFRKSIPGGEMLQQILRLTGKKYTVKKEDRSRIVLY